MAGSGSLTQAATVARFTAKEARGNHLVRLAAAAIGAGLGLAALLGEISLTESRIVQATMVGEFHRLAAAFLLTSFVVNCMVRESNDRVLELVLALSIKRSTYLLGKFAGFGAVALLLSFLFAFPLLAFAAPGQAFLWGMSLAIELLVLAALALLCVLSFTHGVAALAAVFSFYVLARSITTLELIADSPLLPDSTAHHLMAGFVHLLALVLPRLDCFARGDWLAYGEGSLKDLLPLALQGGIFTALAISAALFDFHRKNL